MFKKLVSSSTALGGAETVSNDRSKNSLKIEPDRFWGKAANKFSISWRSEFDQISVLNPLYDSSYKPVASAKLKSKLPLVILSTFWLTS